MKYYRIEPGDVIIDAPGAMRWPHRLTNISLTLAIWAMAIWLFQSLITLAAWYFQIYIAHDYLVVLRGWRVGANHVGLGLAVCLLLMLWARLQRWRFAGKERRRFSEPLSNEEIAQWYNVDPSAREDWLQRRAMRVRFERQVENEDVQLVVEPIEH